MPKLEIKPRSLKMSRKNEVYSFIVSLSG